MRGRANVFRRFGLAATLVMGAASGSFAASSSEGRYSVYFADVPLGIALEVLGRDLGFDFNLEGQQRLRVRDLSLEGTPDAIVSGLMREIGMDSFQFNGQVFVAPMDEREVRLVRLENLGPEKALGALDASGLLIPGFEITPVADGKALVLSGPVKYLALAESVLASVPADQEIVEEAVRVRRAGKLETDKTTLSADTAAN